MCDRNLRSDRKPWGPPRDRKVQGNMNVCGGHDTTLEGTGARAEKGTRPPPTPPPPPACSPRHELGGAPNGGDFVWAEREGEGDVEKGQPQVTSATSASCP